MRFASGYVGCGCNPPQCNAMVLVRKKDGTLHFYLDFCRLNACTKKDSYPLPWIQEALESMAGTTHFSMMDFKSGFWQVRMALESQQYTTFTVGNLRFYEFTRVPFGLCNVPATFQHLMQDTLGELNLTYCVIYLDDVIVFGRMEEKHLECLRVVFEVETFQVFLLLVRDSVPYISCVPRGICPSQDNMHAGDVHPSLRILWTSGTLLTLHQRVCMHGKTPV